MKLLWIDSKQIRGKEIVLNEKDSFHLARVLRAQIGDSLELTDGRGNHFSVKITGVSENPLQVITQIENSHSEKGLTLPKLLLAPALFKGPRMDWMFEKVCELGVHEIFPILTERSVIKIHSQAENSKKISRWENLTKTALKQSGQAWLPRIEPILNWMDFLKHFSSLSFPKLLFTPEGKHSPSEWEKVLTSSSADSWLVCIGPEGGFSKSEIEEAQQNGFITCSLGKSTLRAETASIVALTLLNFIKQKLHYSSSP